MLYVTSVIPSPPRLSGVGFLEVVCKEHRREGEA